MLAGFGDKVMNLRSCKFVRVGELRMKIQRSGCFEEDEKMKRRYVLLLFYLYLLDASEYQRWLLMAVL
jgi:hypothetical protein